MWHRIRNCFNVSHVTRPGLPFHKRPEYRFSHLPTVTTMVDRLQNKPTHEAPLETVFFYLFF